MGTATVERAIVLKVPVEILGPGSEYDQRRLALRTEYAQIILEAQKIAVVDSPEALEKANNLGRILQAGTKDAETFFGPIKQQIDGFKAPVLKHEHEFADPIKVEKKRLGGLITVWEDKCAREKEERDRQAREEAERQAREDQLARAVELEATGDVQAAEAVLDEPIFAPAVTRSEATIGLPGKVRRTAYRCIVTDVKALLRAAADGKAPMQCFALDQGWLDRKAGLDKEGFDLPGCKLDKSSSTNFRS